MSNAFRLVACGILLGLPARAQTQGAAASPVERARAIARDAVRGDVAGLSVSIAVGSDVVLDQGFGYAIDGSAATEESSYPVGSLTGAFLSVAALELVADGRLDLSTSVADLLPGAPFREEGLRLKHLLTHTSGIPFEVGVPAPEGDDLDEGAWRALGAIALESAPGECSRFSPTNELLLGRIVERVAGAPLPVWLERRVFEPAGMGDTGYARERPVRTEVVHLHREFGGGVLEYVLPVPPFDAARLHSTAGDLVRWMRGIAEHRLLDSASVDLWGTAPELARGGVASFGHGTGLVDLGGERGFAVGGGSGGCRAHVAYYPALDLVIAVLANGEETDVARIERRIARAFFGQVEPEERGQPLEPALRRTFLGSYYVGCSMHEIAESGERLLYRPPIGPEHVLDHVGGLAFVAADDPELRLTFELEEGLPVAFQLEDHGSTSHATRLR